MSIISLTSFSRRRSRLRKPHLYHLKQQLVGQQQRNAELTDFIENAVTPLHWVDANGIILWANQAELDLLGYSREEYIGHPIAAFHADQAVISDILQRLTRRETLRGYEARMRCKDGSVKHVLINSNVYAQAGKFVHTRCFTHDITERKAVEERLARLQTMTAALSEAITPEQVADVIVEDGLAAVGGHVGTVCLITADGQSLEICNRKGLSEEEFQNHRFTLLSLPTPLGDAIRAKTPLWIDDEASYLSLYPIYETLIKAHQSQGIACLPFMAKGRVIGGMSISFRRPYQLDTATRSFLTTMSHHCAQALERARLYREEQEQREQLRVTLASIGDAVIATDVAGHITFLNGVAAQVTGWKSPTGIGKPLDEVFKIVNETTREPVESPFDKVIETGAIVGLANHTVLLSRDGREVPIDDSGAPIYDADGKTIGVIIVFRDITERKQAEAELRQHIREIATLEERQRLSRDLHDAVSQMLFSSSVIAETLPRVADNPEKLSLNLERLQRLNRGAAAEMRNLLLELRSPEMIEVNLRELLQQLADAAMGHTSVTITVNATVETDLPQSLQIAFYRIAQEALHNIVKHAHAHHASILFTALPERTSLIVKDNGHGFDVNAAAFGLGLHTMRERAEAMGATFEVQSERGQGTQLIVNWTP